MTTDQTPDQILRAALCVNRNDRFVQSCYRIYARSGRLTPAQLVVLARIAREGPPPRKACCTGIDDEQEPEYVTTVNTRNWQFM